MPYTTIPSHAELSIRFLRSTLFMNFLLQDASTCFRADMQVTPLNAGQTVPQRFMYLYVYIHMYIMSVYIYIYIHYVYIYICIYIEIHILQ